MKVGDLVTRKKYNHDMVFKIVAIDGNKVYLHGQMYRLVADAFLDDVQVHESEKEVENFELFLNEDTNIIKGKILHIDGDKTYLRKCMDFYKNNLTPVIGCFMSEDKMKDHIKELLKKHNPDIVIITGHDSFSENRKESSNDGYMNSQHFIDTVKEARIYQPDKDALVIIAGACQSNYEGLIKSGANFASSLHNQNIHALDPACIAICIANTHVNKYVEVEEVLNKTISSKGIGGIDTKGVARKIYK